MPSSKPCKSGQVRYDNRCRTFDKDELYKMSPTELRLIAKKLEIPKYSLMNTSKLMKEIYLYKYDCKPPKVWDTTDRSNPTCRDRKKSPRDKGHSEVRRKCSPPMVYDQDDHTCRARRISPRNKGYAQAQRSCKPPMVWDRETHECRIRKFKTSMKEKKEDIKQATQNLKETVKKVYQLSSVIDGTNENDNKATIAKFKRERSALRLKAQQQAAEIDFEKKKAEIELKDFEANSKILEKQLQKEQELVEKAQLLEVQQLKAEKEKKEAYELAYSRNEKLQALIASSKIQDEIDKKDTILKNEQQKAQQKIWDDEQVVRKELAVVSDEFQKKLDDLLGKADNMVSLSNQILNERLNRLSEKELIPFQVRLDMAMKTKKCYELFLFSQGEAFYSLLTAQSLKEFQKLVFDELKKCSDLYNGRVDEVINEQIANFDIRSKASAPPYEKNSQSDAEVFEDAEQIDVELDQALPNYIEEEEEDLTPQQLESRKYRKARKASPLLARERRQPPSFTGDLKRYTGRYEGLEDDYEMPQI